MIIYGYVLQIEDGRMLSPLGHAKQRYSLSRCKPKIYAELWSAELAIKKHKSKYPGLQVKRVRLEVYHNDKENIINTKVS